MLSSGLVSGVTCAVVVGVEAGSGAEHHPIRPEDRLLGLYGVGTILDHFWPSKTLPISREAPM